MELADVADFQLFWTACMPAAYGMARPWSIYIPVALDDLDL
ncbi:hypothetical protein [Bradyrhizobium jicamae]|nr:hypothetical protein [Bradyrhizobium jicamae]